MTDTEPVSGTVHLLMAFLCWMRESYFRHGPVSLSSSPDIADLWVTCRIFVSQNIFTIGCVRGRVSVSGFPRGKIRLDCDTGKSGRRCEGPGLQFSEYWREIMRLRSVWECVSPHRSGQCRGWRQHHGSPSDITAHTLLTPAFAPGAYYFVLSSSSLPWLSSPGLISWARGNRTPGTSF